MIAKTKRYELPKKTYINLAMNNVIKKYWWALLIPLAVCLIGIYPAKYWYWWPISAFILLGGYLAFWYIQFYGLTTMEQGKVLFEKMDYEITSQQILMKVNSKQGMPVKWDAIKKVKRTKDGFVFFLSVAQLIYLPEKVFQNESHVKFLDHLLKQKGLTKK